MMKPLIAQRTICASGGDPRSGRPGRSLHDARVGHVDDETDDHGDDDEELGEQQLHREQRHAAVDVQDGGEEHQLQHRRQDRQLQLDVGRDPPVDVASEVDGVHQRGEVVVGEDELAGLLGHLRTAAHGDADVGLLQRGGVVDGVAGHGDDLAGLLHEPGEAHLVLGGDAAEDVQLRELLDHLVVAELLRGRCPVITPGPRPSWSAIARAVTVWSPVIMRTSIPARVRDAHGLDGLRAQRVDDADERHQDEVVHRCHRVVEWRRVMASSGRSRAAKASTRRPFSDSCRLASSSSSRTWSIGTCSPCHSAGVHRSMTTSGAPLTVMKWGSWRTPPVHPLRPVVERRHELVLGVERHGRPRGKGAAGLLGVDSDLGGQHDERRLGGVADDRLVVGDGGVAAQHEAEREAVKSGVGSPAGPRMAPDLA